MPHYRTSKHFPGVSSLPKPIQGLMEEFFPPDELPTPAMAMAGPVKQVLPTGIDAVELIKRMQGGISKIPVKGALGQAEIPPAMPVPPWEGLRKLKSVFGY